MILFSLERNSSSIPLSCGFGLGFIHSPQNKIARFHRLTRQNLAISQHKNQLKSYAKCYFVQFLTGDQLQDSLLWPNVYCPRLSSTLRETTQINFGKS